MANNELVKRPPSQQWPVPIQDANDWLWSMAGITKEQRAADFRRVYDGLLAKIEAKSRPQTYDTKQGKWTQGKEEDQLLVQLRALEALPQLLGLAKNPTVHINENYYGTLPDHWDQEPAPSIDVTPTKDSAPSVAEIPPVELDLDLPLPTKKTKSSRPRKVKA